MGANIYKNKKPLFLFLLPAFIFMIVFLYFPFFKNIVDSCMKIKQLGISGEVWNEPWYANYTKLLTDENVRTSLRNTMIMTIVTIFGQALHVGELFTLANYRKAFENLNIFGAYKNSIFISTMVCAVVILLAGLASFALVRYHFKLRNILYMLVVAGMMFPAFATVIPVYTMEVSWGIAGTKNWWLSMLSVILPQVAGNLSFAIIVLTGYIRSLTIELEEAAFMEGCGPVQIFFRVIVPLTKPSFATVAIFSFLWSYNDLFTQMFFLRRPEVMAITRLLNELTSNEGTDYGLMAAAVSLVVVPVLIVYIFMQKYIILDS